MVSKFVITIVIMFLLYGCGGGVDGGNSGIVGGRVGGTVAVTGNIITVVGKGLEENGLASSLKLSGPSSLTFDSDGNYYIADSGHYVVRKVITATGTITTVAGNGIKGYAGDGGLATSAKLDTPSSIAVDSAGNLFIVDAGNFVIRKVTAATGIITTVAGPGTIGYPSDGGLATSTILNGPKCVAVDSGGNFYFTDNNIFSSNSCLIRKVSATTGIITTVAGFGTSGYSGDGGLATSAQLGNPTGIAVDNSGNIYFADSGNQVIRKVTAATGIITTVAGNAVNGIRFGYSGDGGLATSAKLDNPSSVAVDSVGNLYIGDLGNYVIRKVTAATGIITTVAGNGSPRNLVSNAGDDGPATLASFYYISSVSVDSIGDIYIADYYSDSLIRKVTVSTGSITTVAGNNTVYSGFSGDGSLATSAKLSSVSFVAVDNAGNLYLADSGNNRIRKTDIATGIITTVAGNGAVGYSGDGGPATAASLYFPTGITIDSYGNIYFADSGNNRIRKVNIDTGIIITVAGNGSRLYAGGLSGDGGPATSALLSSPKGIALDRAGNIFIADCYNDRIRKVTAATGIITTVTGNGNNSTQSSYSGDGGPATSATVAGPTDIALDSAGNLYIADTDDGLIRKITAATGIISTVAGNYSAAGYSGDGGLATSARLYSPSGITVDNDGNLYISDTRNNCIRKVDAATGIISTMVGNVVAGYSGDGGPASSAHLNSPMGIAIDNAGNLYIADSGNFVIREVPHKAQ